MAVKMHMMYFRKIKDVIAESNKATAHTARHKKWSVEETKNLIRDASKGLRPRGACMGSNCGASVSGDKAKKRVSRRWRRRWGRGRSNNSKKVASEDCGDFV